MTFPEIRIALEAWHARGERAGTATLVSVHRSAPRLPGARFAASEGGDIAGSVSAGCVESDLHEHIQQVIRGEAPQLLSYGITDEMAAGVGLSCGGEIQVLVAAHDPEDPVWPALGRVLDEDGAALLLTGLDGEFRGRVLLSPDDGSRVGSLGDEALDREALAAAAPLRDTGAARIVELREGTIRLFAEAFVPAPRLLIVGATRTASALCHLASYVGMTVTVVDPREALARPEAFPDAARVIRAWPEEGLAEAGLDRYASVVALAHDAKLDVPALAAAIRAGCRYVGQIGGRRTQRLRREALAELGVDPEGVERIRGPVGLPIGAASPVEIALSILAEVIAVRRLPDG
ncbi:MAG: XdhC family protein [Gemmatimonadota bacterium]